MRFLSHLFSFKNCFGNDARNKFTYFKLNFFTSIYYTLRKFFHVVKSEDQPS